MPGDPELPAHTPWAGLPYSRIFWSVVSRTICSMRAGQQDSIERIGMQRREGANVENMRCSDRKLTESGVQCLFPESYRVHAEVSPAKAVLDDHLPDAHNADQDVIGRISDDVARAQ